MKYADKIDLFSIISTSDLSHKNVCTTRASVWLGNCGVVVSSLICMSPAGLEPGCSVLALKL